MEPIVLNRLVSGPFNVLGTTRSTCVERWTSRHSPGNGGLGDRRSLTSLCRATQAAAVEKPSSQDSPRWVLDIARCRSQESGRK